MEPWDDDPWPDDDERLVALQRRLGEARTPGWVPPPDPLVGGCVVAFAQGEAGPGAPGDRAWAAAVSCAAQDLAVVDDAVVADRVPAAYRPGLLARREGPVLAAAVAALARRPDVLLVDATGLDHPRRAGLAVHLGAVLDLPTIGVTHRGLTAAREPTTLGGRGDAHEVVDDGEVIGAWCRVRSDARPVLVHAGWGTDVTTALRVVLAASTEAARTPIPLQAARERARLSRAGRRPSP